MGAYLSPGNASHRMARNSQAHVDEGEMILCLNAVVSTSRRHASVSRPCRFVRDLAREYPEVGFFDKDDLPRSFQDVYAEKV